MSLTLNSFSISLDNNTFSVTFTYTGSNPVDLYISTDNGGTFTLQASGISTSYSWSNLYDVGTQMAVYVTDGTLTSATRYLTIPIRFDQFLYSQSFGSNFLDIYYTYGTQANNISFYYSQNGGASYTNLGVDIPNSPYFINSNTHPGLFVEGTIYGYLYDATVNVSSPVSTTTYTFPPALPFAICTITYGYDTVTYDTNTLTVTYNDTYDATPYYTTYKWLINGTQAGDAGTAGIVPITLYSNQGKESYFIPGATFCNTISNPSCNILTNNYLNFTNPDTRIISTSLSFQTSSFTTGVFYSYPSSFINSSLNLQFTFPNLTSTFVLSTMQLSTNLYYLSTTSTIVPQMFAKGASWSTLVSDTLNHSTQYVQFYAPYFAVSNVNLATATSTITVYLQDQGNGDRPLGQNYVVEATTSLANIYTNTSAFPNIEFDKTTYPNLFINGGVNSFKGYNNSPITTPDTLSTESFAWTYPTSFRFEISSVSMDLGFSTMILYFIDDTLPASPNYQWRINDEYTGVFTNTAPLTIGTQIPITMTNNFTTLAKFFAPSTNSNIISNATNGTFTSNFDFNILSFNYLFESIQLNPGLKSLSVNTTYYQNNNGPGVYPSSFNLFNASQVEYTNLVNAGKTLLSTTQYVYSTSNTGQKQVSFGVNQTPFSQYQLALGSTFIYQAYTLSTNGLVMTSTITQSYTVPSTFYISSITLSADNKQVLTYFDVNFSSPLYYERLASAYGTFYASTISSPIIFSSFKTSQQPLFNQFNVITPTLSNDTGSVSYTPNSNYVLNAALSTFSITSLFFDSVYQNLTINWQYFTLNPDIVTSNLRYAWSIQCNGTTSNVKDEAYQNMANTLSFTISKHTNFDEFADYFLGGAQWSTFITAYTTAGLAAGYSNKSPEAGQIVSSLFYISTIAFNADDSTRIDYNFIYNLTAYDQDFTLFINNTDTGTRGPAPQLYITETSFPLFFSQGFNGNAYIKNNWGGSPPPLDTPIVSYYVVHSIDAYNQLMPSTGASEFTIIRGDNVLKSIMLPPASCNAGKVLHFKYKSASGSSVNKFIISPYILGTTQNTSVSYILSNTGYDSQIDNKNGTLLNFGKSAEYLYTNPSVSLLSDGNNWYTVAKYDGNSIGYNVGTPNPDVTAYEPYGAQVTFWDWKDGNQTGIQLAPMGDSYLKFLVMRNSTGSAKPIFIYTPSTSAGEVGAEGYIGAQYYFTTSTYPSPTNIQPNEIYSFMFNSCPSTTYESIYLMGYANLTSTLSASFVYSETPKILASSIGASLSFSTFQTISSIKTLNHGNLYLYKNLNSTLSTIYLQAPTSTNSTFFVLGNGPPSINTITNKNPDDRQHALWTFTSFSTNTFHTMNIPVMYFAYPSSFYAPSGGGGGGSNSNT